MLSVIIPALNEGATIAVTLAHLQPMRARGAEVIVVDGGSDDATVALATGHADQIIASPRGRAAQMNAGARAASGDVLLFLHADCLLPANAIWLIHDALRGARHVWGRFDVRITGASTLLPMVASMMNLRSRLTGIATGDQGLFMTRTAFLAMGGFPAIPLMEDIAMSRALKRLSKPACLRDRITTSGRRWETHGVATTIVLMWRLRAAYFFGADPARLALHYRGPRD